MTPTALLHRAAEHERRADTYDTGLRLLAESAHVARNGPEAEAHLALSRHWLTRLREHTELARECREQAAELNAGRAA